MILNSITKCQHVFQTIAVKPYLPVDFFMGVPSRPAHKMPWPRGQAFVTRLPITIGTAHRPLRAQTMTQSFTRTSVIHETLFNDLIRVSNTRRC